MQSSPSSSFTLSERLTIALDIGEIDAVKKLVDDLADLQPIFKIGFHTLFSGGLDLAADLARQGLKIFLDAKLYDIPATVEGGARALAAQGYWCMTAHAQAQNIAGAVKGASGSDTRIFGVTVLTSMDQDDLAADGVDNTIEGQVLHRAGQALGAGATGLIASPHEVTALRDHFGMSPLLITPGVRPKNTDQGDQMRVMTPGDTIRAGADSLVIGRPILQASSPLDAAKRILDEIHSVL